MDGNPQSGAVTTPGAPPPATTEGKARKEEGSFIWFLVKLVIAVLVFRTFIFTSFMIPSESMMPRLLEGDYLFAAKWPYGYSRASLPMDFDVGSGRLFGRLPERGDVLIFKHPVDRTDYVKRVIGLPGDQIQMVAGVLHIDGKPVRKVPARAARKSGSQSARPTAASPVATRAFARRCRVAEATKCSTSASPRRIPASRSWCPKAACS
jgi:signal peptidase I